MSLLTIHPETGGEALATVRDPNEMANRLWEIGVLFERWTAEQEFSPEADQETVIAAYRRDVNRLIDRYEFHSVDVVSLHPDHPQKSELRSKFLSEHTHDDFEVRFFVEGKALFYLHPDERVFIVMCEQGDLISIPAHTRHWFDMGENPDFKCIRLFATPEGWVASYTGDEVAGKFPTFDQYRALYA